MRTRPYNLSDIPPEQQAIRARCFHSSGSFKEFAREELESSVPQRFERIVRLYPENIAVKTADQPTTYAQLNAMANRVAHLLARARGSDPEPIGLLFKTGESLLASMIGVLKAGKFFVLLDPSFPTARIKASLEETSTELILTDHQNLSLAKQLSDSARQVMEFESIDSNVPTDDLRLQIGPDSIAYVVYTSGSTGYPKGVVHNHRGRLHFVSAFTNIFHVCEKDRSVLLTSGTGNAVANSLFALLNGAALLPFDVKSEGSSRLAKWLIEERISLCSISAPLFRKLCEELSGEELFPDLRLLRLTSEASYKSDIDLYRKYFPPSCLLANMLCPTEAGLLRSFLIGHNTEIKTPEVPLGYAVEDKEVQLLDDEGNEVGFNEIGEIVVRSKYLSLGYWNQPDLSATKFKSDLNGSEAKLYYTGDMGLMLPDGCLVHKGRKDFRIKVRGYGVDITEVESALLSHESVAEAVLVPHRNQSGESYLVAYCTSKVRGRLSVTELRNFLRQRLTDYMIPSYFVLLSSLPRTLNGKVDRLALPPPNQSRPELATEYFPATTQVQKKLVKIWTDTLAISQVGVRDNFFDLGGHSLAAVSALAKVKKEFNVELPIGIFVKAPVIEELAKQIEVEQHNRMATQWSYLFRLGVGGERSPVFFLPGGIGGEDEFFVYARLTRHIGGEHPFFGLKARSAQGTLLSQDSVQEMAADYLSEIRSLQPLGPYHLVGECAGGIIAYEIAQQLRSQGQEIALLILMDTPRPDLTLELARRLRRRFQPIMESHIIRCLRDLRRQLHGLTFDEKISYIASKQDKIIPQLVGNRESCLSKSVDNPNEYFQRSYSRAIYRYRPRPYAGKLILLRSGETERTDPTLGWKEFAHGGIELCTVAGTHTTYIREYVQSTAKRIREYLEGVDSKILLAYWLSQGIAILFCEIQPLIML